LLTDPSGLEFDACYARRVEGDLDGLRVPMIGVSDLIVNKSAAGRTKDLADVEKLQRIAEGAKRRVTKSSKRKRR
jgi:predicted nucleotidyltransferase